LHRAFDNRSIKEAVDQEQSSGDAPSVSRGQNQLHLVPEDWHTAAGIIEPLIARVDAAQSTVQLLVVTGDTDAAAHLAEALVGAAAEASVRLVAVTDARRAARSLRGSTPHVVVGSATTLVEVVQASALKLDSVKLVVLAWVDRVSPTTERALEAIMADVAKESVKYVLAAAPSAQLDQLVERYARRARKPAASDEETLAAVSVTYIATSHAGRRTALRRLLDALDPDSAYVVAKTPRSREDVSTALRSLGYSPDSQQVRAGDEPDALAKLVIFYDLPTSGDEVRRLASARIFALPAPRQIAALRRFAGGAVTPFTLPEAAARARSSEQALQDELREELGADEYSRELIALEPLLNDFDGIELAAAALRLLEKARAKLKSSGGGSQASMTRLFVNVGDVDGVRPGDLVGAITNEAGISREELGRVEIRERNSIVEVATSVANNVVSRMTGVSMKGRRVLVKVDEDRPERPRGDRPPSRGDRPPRRDGPPRDRAPRDRSDRPTRPRSR
jgi:ATP-dependent RNA helicase DeaD